jgi:hypothetical protein
LLNVNETNKTVEIDFLSGSCCVKAGVAATGRREQVNGRHSCESDYYLCNFHLARITVVATVFCCPSRSFKLNLERCFPSSVLLHQKSTANLISVTYRVSEMSLSVQSSVT